MVNRAHTKVNEVSKLYFRYLFRKFTFINKVIQKGKLFVSKELVLSSLYHIARPITKKLTKKTCKIFFSLFISFVIRTLHFLISVIRKICSQFYLLLFYCVAQNALQLRFFFSLIPSAVFGRTGKSFLSKFHHLFL